MPIYSSIGIPDAWKSFQRYEDNAALIEDFAKQSTANQQLPANDRCRVLFNGVMQGAITLAEKYSLSWEEAINSSCASAVNSSPRDAITKTIIERISTWAQGSKANTGITSSLERDSSPVSAEVLLKKIDTRASYLQNAKGYTPEQARRNSYLSVMGPEIKDETVRDLIDASQTSFMKHINK